MNLFWTLVGRVIDRNEERKADKRYREMVGMDLPLAERRERDFVPLRPCHRCAGHGVDCADCRGRGWVIDKESLAARNREGK